MADGSVRLHAGSVPDGQFPWRAMFNTDAFYALRGAPCWHQPLTTFDGTWIGDATWHTTEGVSGWSAPFGGCDWRREFWRPEQIREAIGDLASDLTIRCKPASYGENEAATLQALIQVGFRVKGSDLNYSIALPDSIDEYEQSLTRQARAALDKGEEMGLTVEEIPAEGYERLWSSAYHLLRRNREAKGRALSLTLDYVRAIRDQFPGLVRMLGCWSDNQARLVAAALVYRIGAGRDLVQFWGDMPIHGLPRSPMNLLVREVVQHSIATGARVLDLGISTEGGEVNAGLARFKRSVGAKAEPRFVLVR